MESFLNQSGRCYILAPMAGYTDLPFRMSCRAQGAFYMFTALIDSGALVHGNKENESILKRGNLEPWLGVQLLGSIEGDIAKSAEMLDAMNFDLIDFNMGCPMQKVTRRPAGAALVSPENHRLAFRCVELIRSKVHKPFTVKIRILDFNDPEPTVQFCKRLEGLGVEGITIHGRLTKSIYSGPVATSVISAVRENVSVPVIANGGIFSLADANSIATATGCDRLMVARGAVGNPWIFRELLGIGPARPTHDELCDAMQEHIEGMVACYGERTGLILARKICTAYLHGRGYRKEYRVRGSQIAQLIDFYELMNDLRAEGPAVVL